LTKKAKPGYKLSKLYFRKFVKIPDEWETIPVSQLCKLRKDNGISSNLYIGLEHICQGENKLEGKGCVEDFESNKKVFQKGDILYGKLRPLLNKIWVATENGYSSTDILPIIVNEKIDKIFFAKMLSSPLFLWYAVSTSSGTKMPRTNWNDIKKYNMIYPPIQEQQKIASILSNVDNLITSYEKAIDYSKKRKKGLMQKLLTKGIGHTKFKKVKWYFGKFEEIPEEWAHNKLKNVVKLSQGIQVPEDEQSYVKLEGYERFLRIVDYQEKIPPRYIQKPKSQYFVNEDNMVMVRYGAGAGNVYRGLKGAIANNLFQIIPTNSNLNNNFLFIFLKRNFIEKYLRNISGSTTMPNINHELVYNIYISIPSFQEQQKIASILSNADFKIIELESTKSNLMKLKKGLMQKLLTGQIRVNG